MTLVKQPSRRPTRKIRASFIGGILAGAIIGGMQYIRPDLDLGPLTEPLAIGIAALIGPVLGYMTRERAQ